MEKLS